MELYNEQLEKIVIGSLISSDDLFSEVKDILKEECFYVDLYKRIFKCLLELDSEGKSPDIVTLQSRMKAHGWNIEIWELMDIASNRTFSIAQHSAELHDLYVRRTLIFMAEKLKSDANNPMADPNEIISSFNRETEKFYRVDEGGTYSMLDTLTELQKSIGDNVRQKKSVTGTPTGFRKFDEATSGFHDGDLVIVAAESSQGKTSMALNVIVNAAMSGEKVAIYSMEMTRKQLAARMVSSESGVSSSSILYKPLSGEQLISVDNAMGRLSNCEIFFDDRSTSNIDTIISSIRYMKKHYDINGAAVDYIQLLSLNGRGQQTEEQALGEFARRFKNLAKELDIWIMALSQLNRDKANPIPNNNRLRGTGQIVEAADTVMLLYRPEVYGLSFPEPFENTDAKGKALIIVSKGRNTGMTEFLVGFDAPKTKFYELEDYEEYSPIPPMPEDEARVYEEITREDNEKLPF